MTTSQIQRPNKELVAKVKGVRAYFRQQLGPILENRHELVKRKNELIRLKDGQRLLDNYSKWGEDVEAFEAQFVAHRLWVHVRSVVYLSKLISDKKPKRVLDAGCGTGLKTCLLTSEFPEIEFVGYDVVPSFVDRSKERAKTLGLKNVKFYVSSHSAFDSKKEFDLIYEIGALDFSNDIVSIDIMGLSTLVSDTGLFASLQGFSLSKERLGLKRFSSEDEKAINDGLSSSVGGIFSAYGLSQINSIFLHHNFRALDRVKEFRGLSARLYKLR